MTKGNKILNCKIFTNYGCGNTEKCHSRTVWTLAYLT